MDPKRHLGGFVFKIERADNDTFIASVKGRRGEDDVEGEQDDVGALYYVVVVILIYGCSILMMIASYIRKNKVDRRLGRYLKEMANVRKREEQSQLFTAAAKAAALHGGPDPPPQSAREHDSPPAPRPGARYSRNQRRESGLFPPNRAPRSNGRYGNASERRRLLRAGNVRFAPDVSDDPDEYCSGGEAEAGGGRSIQAPMYNLVKLVTLMAPQVDLVVASERPCLVSAGSTDIPGLTAATVIPAHSRPEEQQEEAEEKAEEEVEEDEPPRAAYSTSLPGSPSSSSSSSSPNRTSSSSSSSSITASSSTHSSSTWNTSDFQVITTV